MHVLLSEDKNDFGGHKQKLSELIDIKESKHYRHYSFEPSTQILQGALHAGMQSIVIGLSSS